MLRRKSCRSLALLIAALLLVPAGIVRAETPAPPQTPSEAQLRRQAIDDRQQDAAYIPAILQDQGLQAQGGPGQIDRARQQSRASQAEAAAAAKAALPASAAPAPEYRPFSVSPPSHLPAPGSAVPAAATVTPPPVVRNPATIAEPALFQPLSQAQPAGWMDDWELTATGDVFPAGSIINTTVTLRHGQLPVAGATVTVGDGPTPPSFTTDANGVAAITLTAPADNAELPVRVTVDGALSNYHLHTFFVVKQGFGAVIVSNVTNNQETRLFNHWSVVYEQFGRINDQVRSVSGMAGTIVEAGTTVVETRAWDGSTQSTYYWQHEINVPSGGKQELHPSGSLHQPVTFAPGLEGTALTDVQVGVHPSDMVSYTSTHQNMGSRVYLAPGEYNALIQGKHGTEQIVMPAGFIVSDAPMTLSPQAYSLELSPAAIELRDVDNIAVPWNFVVLESGYTGLQVNNPGGPIYLAPGRYKPARLFYAKTVGEDWEQNEYHYWFDGKSRSFTEATPTPSAITWQFGYPWHPYTETWGQPMQGNQIWFATFLQGRQGDVIDMFHCQQPNPCTPVQGEFSIYNNAGTKVYSTPTEGHHRTWEYSVPGDATGEYMAELAYDLGPMLVLIKSQLRFQIIERPDVAVTISKDVFARGETDTVTVHVTNHGQPVSGADVSVRGIHYPTNANGDATFTFSAPNWSEVYGVWVALPNWSGRPVNLFVKRPEEAILIVRGATDKDGNPLRGGGEGTFTTPFPDGNLDTRNDWLNETSPMAVVRSAGETYIEFASGPATDLPGYFLYQQVTLAENERKEIVLSGQGTQRITVTASLDGAALDGAVILHNEAMAHRSTSSKGLMNDEIYVTPGIYSIGYQSYNPAVLLARSNVDLNGPTDVTITAASEGLALLDLTSTYNEVDPLSVWMNLNAGLLAFNPDSNRTYKVTPGVGYGLWAYWFDLEAGVEDWHYHVDARNSQVQTPVPGETFDLGLVGPLHVAFEFRDPVVAGQHAGLELRLVNDAGHLFDGGPTNAPMPEGSVSLLNAAGESVWSNTFYGLRWGTGLDLPQVPGTYTLVGDLNSGPLQGPIHTEQQIEVLPPPAPPQVTVSPKVIPTGVDTTVTVTVTKDGQPLTGQPVNIDGWDMGTTNTNGEVTVTVRRDWHTIVRVWVHNNADDRWYNDLLYALEPDLAAVEVTARLQDGQKMYGFLAAAEAPNWGWSQWDDNGKAGLIVPAGSVRLDLMREGKDAYFLNSVVNVAPMTFTPVELNGADSVLRSFNVTPTLTGGWFSLHPEGKQSATWISGMELNGQAAISAHVTPGNYSGLVRGNLGTRYVVHVLPGQLSLQAPGNQSIDLGTLPTAPVDLKVMYDGAVRQAGFGFMAGPFRVNMEARPFEITPGSYLPDWLGFGLTQSNGEYWQYDYAPTAMSLFTVTAGQQPLPLTYNLDVVNTEVQLNPKSYYPGDRLEFRLAPLTDQRWMVREIHRTDHDRWDTMAPITSRITDAGSAEVWSQTDYHTDWYGWQVPNNPSPNYTVQMSRDMGALGTVNGQATATLRQPLTISVDREIVPTGRPTAVTITVTEAGKPVFNNWVRVYGPEYDRWELTNRRGQLHVKLEPTMTALYTVEVWTPGESFERYLYALGPGYGLLNVDATDRSGAPMTSYIYSTTQPPKDVKHNSFGYSNPVEPEQKYIARAGMNTVALRGRDSNYDHYYFSAPVNVAEGVETKAQLTPAGTVELGVQVANPPAGKYNVGLMFRNKALDMDEDVARYLMPGRKVYATPGTYEAALAVYGGTMQGFLYKPAVEVNGTNTVTFDLSTATSMIQINPTVPAGWLRGEQIVAFRIGRLLWEDLTMPDGSYAVTPGTYTLTNAAFDLLKAGTPEIWSFGLEGSQKLTLAPDQVQHVNLGAPTSSGIKVNPPVTLAGGKVSIDLAYDCELGMRYRWVDVFQDDRWQPVWSHVTLAGPGGYWWWDGGTHFGWQASPVVGTYNIHSSWTFGPYGTFTADSTVQVIRLRRP